MRSIRTLASGLVVALLVGGAVTRAANLGTAFTYQGELALDNKLVNEACDFEFSLWDASTGGIEVGDSPQPVPGVDLIGGRFTVPLDFGPEAVTGEARWLEIAVCCPSPCAPGYSFLDGRQELRPAPYSLRASTGVGGPTALNVDAAGNVGIGTATPTAKLDITGTPGVDGIKFPDGSLQTSSATTYPWTKVGDDIFYNDGSVGIGTNGPFVAFAEDSLQTMSATLQRSTACAASPSTGKIYCFGGTNPPAEQHNDILEYDPVSDQWTGTSALLPSVWVSQSCVASTTTGMIYCFGGWRGGAYVDDILRYDPTNPDTAPVLLDARLPTARYGVACAEAPSTQKIYCFGGYDVGGLLDEIVEFDPVIPPVGPLPKMSAQLPTPRYWMACAGGPSTGNIYCFGGDSGGLLDEILEFDASYPYIPDEAIPILNAVLPTARSALGCAAATTTGKIYCFGGIDGGDLDNLVEIVEYDPTRAYVLGEKIDIMAPMLPTQRRGSSCAASETTGKIYCFGGYSGAGTYPVEIVAYTPSTAQTRLQVGNPGDGNGATANAWSVFSSRAFKRDISALGPLDYQDILAKLKATDVVRYRYAADARQTVHLGVIAEDSPAEILSPGGKAVSLSDYTAFLMAAIKGQQAELSEKDRRIYEMARELADTQTDLGGTQTELDETQARLTALEAIVAKLTRAQEGGGQ